MDQKSDEYWMSLAIKQAEKAAARGEVPIGAVCVKAGKLVSKAYNLNISNTDPTAHAEILALRAASKKLNNYRLNDVVLYSTIEPCPMCLGAIIYARIKKVVFGAKDPKAGACGSVLALHKYKKLNHSPSIKSGVLSEPSSDLIKYFFKKIRRAG